MRRLPQGAITIVGMLTILLLIGAFAIRECDGDTRIPAAAQVTITPAVAVTAPTATTTHGPSTTATTRPVLPTSTPRSYRGVALGGRDDNEDIRRWIDQHGGLGHGSTGYDHWVEQRRLLAAALLRLDRISAEELDDKRQRLIRFFWGEAGFPARTPHAITKGISDARYAFLTNLASIDRIEVIMEFGVNSVIYLFHPSSSNGRLLIYHQGHGGDFFGGRDTIHFFLRHGYAVAAFAMPLLGMNSQPTIETPNGKMTLHGHDDFRFLGSDVFSPMRFFVEPITVFLNYAIAEYEYNLVAMVGLSGGGWTTTLYAALDPHIERSYPVAGVLPLYLEHTGGYEEPHPGLYAIANYLELYVLGTYRGRRQIQVLNRYDPCCFSGTEYRLYEEQVARTAQRVGNGSFSVFSDETHREHKISEAALAVILSDLERP